MYENILIVFIRYPEPGKVKTRLAKAIGEEMACSLYRLFAEATVERTHSKTGQYFQALFHAPADSESNMREWLTGEWRMYPQRGDSLGDRMRNAFARVFAEGAKRAVIIGTDSPLLNDERVSQAFHMLEDKDVVIGPTVDGGYYLLGLSSMHKEIFSDIDWSTDRVYRQTVERAEKKRLSLGRLPTHFDVDDEETLRMLKSELVRIWPHDKRGLEKLYEILMIGINS